MTDLTDALLEAHNLLRSYQLAWYVKNFDGLDPNQGQGLILSTLHRMNVSTQMELGNILRMRPQALVEHLQKLEAHGYITRHRSTIDRRTFVIELTDKGEAFQMITPDYGELFIDLSTKEKVALKKSLEKMSRRLTKLIEKESADEFY